MGPSWWQILTVLVLLVLLFGRGRISGLMSDVAKGLRAFRLGLADVGERSIAGAADDENGRR